MGTRADFYVGRGETAEWLGSIAFDGYDDGPAGELLLSATSEADFRQKVEQLSRRDDFTAPRDGWPWPWEDSHTTDYAYAWDGQTWASCFGRGWRSLPEIRQYHAACKRWDGDGEEPELWSKSKDCVFPDMTSHARVARGTRSGLLIMMGVSK